MKRIIAAAILAALGAAAHAQDIVVPLGESCPPGTTQTVPSYTFENGRLVRDGTVCQDRRYRN
jgi:hypothetical protein